MDECGICGKTLPEHDSPEVNHQFNIDGVLVPKAKKQPASTPKPQLSRGDVTLRLITVLRTKGILDDTDLGIIFAQGGDHAPADAG